MEAVVAGHICLDIIPEFIPDILVPDTIPHRAQIQLEHFLARLRPGHLIEIGAAALATGGPVSNTGLALHRLGVPTRLMGKVGADIFGQLICNLLDRRSPDFTSGMIVDSSSATSYTIILNPPGVDRMFLHNPGANNTFAAADIDYTRVAHANLFHFGYPPVMRRMYESNGQQLLEVFRQVKTGATLTSLDMAYPDPDSPAGQADWRTIFRQVLPYIDIFLPSLEELLFCIDRPLYARLAGRGQDLLQQASPALLRSLSDDLLSMGAKIIVIKLGERGLYLRTARNLDSLAPQIDPAGWQDIEYWAPCFAVDVVGTTGSGDATIAGFLTALLHGLTPANAMTMAVAVGACNVEAADAYSGLRTWEDTLARIQSGWPRLPLQLDAPGWRWLPDQQIWTAD